MVLHHTLVWNLFAVREWDTWRDGMDCFMETYFLGVSPHLRNAFFPSTITTWELVQNQVEWNETNSINCSYPFGEAECEGERHAAKCFPQGGVTFPEITRNYSKIRSTVQFSLMYLTAYTPHQETRSEQANLTNTCNWNQEATENWVSDKKSVQFYTLTISQLRGSRYFFKAGKHTSDVA